LDGGDARVLRLSLPKAAFLKNNKNSFDDSGNLMHNYRLRLKKYEVSA